MIDSKSYSIANQTTNGILDSESLTDQIRKSEISIALKDISTAGDTVTINFKGDIDGTEELILDTLVNMHKGEPLIELETIITQTAIPEGGKKKTDRGFTFTALAGATTTHDYIVGEDLQIKGGLLQTSNQHVLDSVHMDIVDHDFLYVGVWYAATPTLAGIPNVDGLTWQQIMPSGVPLHSYLRAFPVSITGRTSVKNEAITTTPLKGLTIRLTYVSNGTLDVPCNVGIIAYT